MELGSMFDTTVSIPRRKLEITDDGMARVVWVRLEMQDTGEVFVGSGGTEGLSAGKRGTVANFDTGNWHGWAFAG
jgi:hypothetical protein